MILEASIFPLLNDSKICYTPSHYFDNYRLKFVVDIDELRKLCAGLIGFDGKITKWENKYRILWKLMPYLGISLHFIAAMKLCKSFCEKGLR